MTQFHALHDAISEIGVPTTVRKVSQNEEILIAHGRDDYCGLEMCFRFHHERLLVTRCIATCKVPPGSRSDAEKLASMISECLALGHFYVDDEGDVSFQAASYVDEENVAFAARNLLCIATFAMNKFIPAFLSIIFANETPDVAFARA